MHRLPPPRVGQHCCGWPVLQVSLLYTAPTAIRSLMAKGDSFVTKHSRRSLRVLGTVGEPINPAGQPAALLPAWPTRPCWVCTNLPNLALMRSAASCFSAAVICWTCYFPQLSLAPAHCWCAVQPHLGLTGGTLLPSASPAVSWSHLSALCGAAWSWYYSVVGEDRCVIVSLHALAAPV